MNNESSIFSYVALTITRVAAHSARLLTSRVIWFPPFPSARLLTSNISACFRAQRKAPSWEWRAYHSAISSANERATQKKHHRISHLPNQLEMIHLVIIVRESQPVSPNPNHSKQSCREIFTIASLFLLPLFSASYLQVLSNVELSSAKYLFLLSFGKRSQGDQKHTTNSQFFFSWYKLHHRQTRWQ